MIDEKDIPKQLERVVQLAAEQAIYRLRSNAMLEHHLSIGRVRVFIQAESVSVLGDVGEYHYEASAGRHPKTDPGPESVMRNWPEATFLLVNPKELDSGVVPLPGQTITFRVL